MTGRYMRKSVPLEVRGVSRGSQEIPLSLPLSMPLDHKNNNNVPPDYIHSVNHAISSFNDSPSYDSSCGSSSPTSTPDNNSVFSGPSYGWTTGNTTERSSIYSATSWGDDEFDRQASKTVKNLFEEIDSVLFERCHSGPDHVISECGDWTTTFPHFRILGSQQIAPQDQGYQAVPHESPRPQSSLLVDVTEQDLSGTSELNELVLTGHHVKATSPPKDNRKMSNDSSISANSYYDEEVFEQDGNYEDVIALDYSDDSRDGKTSKKSPRRRYHGYPPMTPLDSAKDSVNYASFDSCWHHMMLELHGLLCLYHEEVVHSSTDEGGPMFPAAPGLDVIPPSREMQEKADSFDYENSNKLPQVLSFINEEARPQGHGPGLMDLIHISSMPLFKREISAIPENEYLARQGSMLRPFSTSQSRTINSAQTRSSKKYPGRLAPLTTDQVKTPNIDEEPFGGIQGHRLQTANERLSTPPGGSGVYQKNGALPPIGLDPLEALPQIKNMKKGSRASSAVAVADKDSRTNLREREKSAHPLETRPSTTHTFRSDTPLGMAGGVFRRSSTPMGFSTTNSRTSLHGGTFGPSPMVRDNVGLGITGNSITHSQQTQNLNQESSQILEDDREYDEIVHNSWAPPHASPNNPYRKQKHVNFASIVR